MIICIYTYYSQYLASCLLDVISLAIYMAITILIRRTVEVLALYIFASLVIGAQSTQVVIPTNPSLPNNTGTFYIYVTTHYKYIGGPTVYVAACTNSKLLILE